MTSAKITYVIHKNRERTLDSQVLHMYGSTKESWGPLVDVLVKKNISTLAIDMRGHGASRFGPKGGDGRKQVLAKEPEIFNHMYLDALAAIAYLNKDLGLDLGRIGVVGASVGCSVAIHASREEMMRGATQIHTALADQGAELVLFDKEDIHGTHMFGEVKGVEEKIAQWLQDKLK